MELGLICGIVLAALTLSLVLKKRTRPLSRFC